MKKREKIVVRWKKISPVKKKIIIGVSIILIILLIMFGGKIYLYINFLLGNDTLIELSADKQEISLLGGEEETIKFKAKITSNPFCEALCRYEFQDISNNKIIDNNNFSLKNNIPFLKQYEIRAKNFEIGQELYRFTIKCNSKATILCNTKEKTVARNLVVTLNYSLNDTDRQYYESLKNNLSEISLNLNNLENEIYYFNDTQIKLQRVIIINESEKLNQLIINTKKLHEELEQLREFWKEQEFSFLKREIDKKKKEIDYARTLSNQLNESIITGTYRYNNLIDNLNSTKTKLELIKNYISNDSQVVELNELIKEFNEEVVSFKSISTIEEKEKEVLNIDKKISDFLLNIDASNQNSGFSFITISEINIEKINLNRNESAVKIDFSEPDEKCCVFNECYECCTTKECMEDPKNYPLVFLHGHQFNKNMQVEFNLDSFDSIQENLENESYLNFGAISSYNEKEIDSWSKVPVPYSIRLSYYYDTLKQSNNYILVQEKSESLDVYAIRLNELIKEITTSTGRPKVIIVTHSMGGLVARRYLQIFGTDKVDKLIMLVSPNKGVEGSVANYCSIFGEEIECEDMKSDSLFINKLNRDPIPNIPIYSIIGRGCITDGQDSDGIVLTKNAILEGADNSFIDGNCKGVEFLHTEIVNIDKYPEVYSKIKEILNKTV